MKRSNHKNHSSIKILELSIIFQFLLLFSCNAQETIDLSSYHECWAMLVDGDNAISFLTPTIAECSNGNAILSFQNFIRREDGKAIYEISDSLSVRVNCPENCLYITRCSNAAETKEYIIMIEEDYSQEYFKKVKRAWTYSEKEKLTEVDSENLKCANQDLGVD
jgi:hypothetical protein